jgi:hypothetical protein
MATTDVQKPAVAADFTAHDQAILHTPAAARRVLHWHGTLGSRCSSPNGSRLARRADGSIGRWRPRDQVNSGKPWPCRPPWVLSVSAWRWSRRISSATKLGHQAKRSASDFRPFPSVPNGHAPPCRRSSSRRHRCTSNSHRAVASVTDAGCPTFDISTRSKPWPPAIPENRSQCGSTRTRPRPPRIWRGPRRTSPPYRSGVRPDVIQDRNRPAIPTARCHRVADALGNRTDMRVTIINVPALMAVVGRPAASEGGHWVARSRYAGNRPIGSVWNAMGYSLSRVASPFARNSRRSRRARRALKSLKEAGRLRKEGQAF